MANEARITVRAEDLTGAVLAGVREALQQTGLSVGAMGDKTKEAAQTTNASAEQIRGSFDTIKQAIDDPVGAATNFAESMAVKVPGAIGVAVASVVGAVAIFGVLAAKLTDLTFEAAAFDAAIDDLSDTTGFSVEQISELQYAVDVVGGSIEQVVGAITKLQSRMEQSPDTFERGLAAIGLTLGEIQQLKPEEQFLLIAEAFRVNADHINRAAVAIDLFGRSGIATIPLLVQPLADLTREAHNAGFTLSTETAAAAEVLEMNSARLHQQLDLLWRKIGEDLIPVFNAILPPVTGVVGGMQDLADVGGGVVQMTLDRLIDQGGFWRLELAAVREGLGFAVAALQQYGLVADETAASLIDATLRLHGMTDAVDHANERGHDAAASMKAYWTEVDAGALKVPGLSAALAAYDQVAKQETETTRRHGEAHGAAHPEVTAHNVALDALLKTIQRIETAVPPLPLLSLDQAIASIGEHIQPALTDIPLLSRAVADVNGTLGLMPDTVDLAAAALLGFDRNAAQVSNTLGIVFADALDALPGIIQRAFEGGGGFEGALRSLGAQIGGTLGKSVGEDLQGTLGDELPAGLNEKLPGILAGVGSAAFSQLGDSWGATLAAGAIAAASRLMQGDWVGAIVAGVSSAIAAVFSMGGPSKEELAARDAQEQFFANLTAHMTEMQDAMLEEMKAKGLAYATETETAVAAIVTDTMLQLGKTGEDAAALMGRLLATQDIETYKGAIAELEAAMQEVETRWAAVGDAGQILNTMVKDGIADLSEYRVVSSSVLAVFDAMVLKTGDVAGALRELGPALDALDLSDDIVATSLALEELAAKGETAGSKYAELSDQLDTLTQQQAAFGAAGGAAIEELTHLSEVAEANKPLMESIAQTTGLLQALDTAGLATSETFTTFGQNAVNQFNQLSTVTGNTREAMVLMQPELQMLWEHQQKFGDITDEATVALLNQAQQEGIVGAQRRTVNEQILDVLTRIGVALGAIPPGFEAATIAATNTRGAVDGVSTSVGAIPTGTIAAVSNGMADIASRASGATGNLQGVGSAAAGIPIGPVSDLSRGMDDVQYRAGVARGNIDNVRSSVGNLSIGAVSDLSRGFDDIQYRAGGARGNIDGVRGAVDNLSAYQAWELQRAFQVARDDAERAAGKIGDVRSNTDNIPVGRVVDLRDKLSETRGRADDVVGGVQNIINKLDEVPTGNFSFDWGYGYHSGGLVMHGGGEVPRAHQGLAVDERMIIAQVGEGILSRDDMRALGGPPAFEAFRHDLRNMGRMPTTTAPVAGLTDRGGLASVRSELTGLRGDLRRMHDSQQNLMKMLPRWIRDATRR